MRTREDKATLQIHVFLNRLRCNRENKARHFDSTIEIEMNVKYLMETKVTFYAVGGEKHFPVAGEYEQEPVQRL